MRKKKQPQVDPFAGYQAPRVGGVTPPWGSAPPAGTRVADRPTQTAPAPSTEAQPATPPPPEPPKPQATTQTAEPPAAPPPPSDPERSQPTAEPGTAGREDGKKAKPRRPKRRDRRVELLDGAVAMNTHRSDLGARAARSALWGVLGLIVLCVLALVLHEGRSAPQPQASAPPPSAPGAGGFAAVFMQRWLPAGEGTESELAPFMREVPALTAKANTRFAAQTPVVLSADQVKPGYWSVLLAVNETVKDKKGDLQPTGTHWYRVAVAQAGSTGSTPGTNDTTVWQITGAPYEVPAPTAADALSTSAYSDTAVPTTGPVADTTQRFLDAYLTGQGELDRYTTPDAPITPVTPPSASEVTIDTIAAVPTKNDIQDSGDTPPDGVTVRVLVHATVTGSDGVTIPMDYPMTLRSRAGRWEVLSLDLAPFSQRASGAPTRQTPTATGGSVASPSTSTSP